MKYVSDLDTTGDGRFSVEWEDDYSTWWETFDTEEERELALQENEDYIKSHRSEYLADVKASNLSRIESNLEMLEDDCGHFLMGREQKVAENYRNWLLRKHYHQADGFPLKELLKVA